MSIFPKLLLTFLLTIVPLFFISLQMNRMGTDSVRTEILNSMEGRVRSNLSSLEAEMERLIRLHQQYVLDDDVTKLSTMASILPYYEVMLMEKRVQNKLLVMKNSNLYVSEAKAYFPLINKTLLTLTFNEGMTPEHVQELQELQRNQVSPVVYWHGNLLINSIYPNPSYSIKPPVYILQSEIDNRQLQRFLQQMIINKGGEGSILFNEQQEWTISSQGDEEVRNRVRTFISELPPDQNFGQVTIQQQNYYVTYEQSRMLNMKLAIYMPEQQMLGPLVQYRVWFWILSGFSLAIVLVFSYWIFRLIHYPLRKLVRAFRRVEQGELSLSIEHRNDDEFQYLYSQFNNMVSHLKQSVEEVYHSRIMAQQAELKQLQSQINPHFLYNTYFMVHRMSEAHDVENVSKATHYLGKYFLYITRNASDVNTLQEDWEHTIAFIEIQQMRFHHRIEAQIMPLDEALQPILIPRLTLQPLIENAYEHGLKSKPAAGLVRMHARKDSNGQIIVTIEDNGDHLSDEQLQAIQKKLTSWQDMKLEKTGMLNVHLRIQLKFGKPYGLKAERSSLGGLKLELYLPGVDVDSQN